ncbi:gastrula zinc finger protein XlCGF71.1-like isoform X1 [Bufo gargarizans]|uniref:gastrula zinc finger protein XlCGF71.1-like isoform X1 n=2 Tax=Bufo gargarizans TaxID=30331 RepID=UPI001CF2F93A|nr:gastrula zinc finger protein XlCGF71.1-like isoform X1 [Bufo gargarizans]
MMEEHQPLISQENLCKNSIGNFMLSLNYKAGDEDIMQRFSGDNLNVDSGLHSTNNHEELSPDQSHIVTINIGQRGGKRFVRAKEFTKRSRLSANRRTRTGETPYSCSECGKCFTKKTHLITHEKIHPEEKPCSECGKCFTDKSSLVDHKRRHIGEKLNSCSKCEKCFTRKSGLVRHEKSHSGEKPYSCSECGKFLTDKSSLVKHKRIHTGEKPYLCSECGKCFADKSSLRRHERRHRGEKPYSCSECGKCFKNKSSIARHEKHHTGEMPFFMFSMW